MNKEIEEMLDNLKEDIEQNILIEVRGSVFKPLLDYITNLQEENKEVNKLWEIYSKSIYYAQLTEAKAKIDKAIEYLILNKDSIMSYRDREGEYMFQTIGESLLYEDLLDILRGKEVEDNGNN